MAEAGWALELAGSCLRLSSCTRCVPRGCWQVCPRVLVSGSLLARSQAPCRSRPWAQKGTRASTQPQACRVCCSSGSFHAVLAGWASKKKVPPEACTVRASWAARARACCDCCSWGRACSGRSGLPLGWLAVRKASAGECVCAGGSHGPGGMATQRAFTEEQAACCEAVRKHPSSRMSCWKCLSSGRAV